MVKHLTGKLQRASSACHAAAIGVALALTWGALQFTAGCGPNSLSRCSVTCSIDGTCPSGYVCNAARVCVGTLDEVCPHIDPDGPLPTIDAPLTDGSIDASLFDASNEVCNVLADTGCEASKKCTWVIDSWTGPEATGHVDCRPVGSVALGGPCMIGAGGSSPQGSDNCGKGLYCTGGVCKPVCDLNGGAPTCGANFACQPYANTFGNLNETPHAGICDPSCDPLTNRVDGTNEANCKATIIDPNTTAPGFPAGYPNRGCYGLWDSGGKSRWTCTSSGPATGVQDFVLGTVFINSCAAGFFPGLSRGTGTMMAICSALCNPGDAYMGAPATQIGGLKRGTDVSTCNERGAVGMDCVHGWFFEIADDGSLMETKYGKLGVCMNWTRYTSATTMMPFKQCQDLVKNDADQMLDLAFNQGCRPSATHPLLPGPVQMNLSAQANEMRRSFRSAFPMTLLP